MPRGAPDSDLAQALQVMISRDPVDGHRRWTVEAILHELLINHERYDGPRGGFSRPTVDAAVKGRPITSRTAEVLRRFVQVKRPDLFPRIIPKVDLDLGHFFGATDAFMVETGRAIVGNFQTYARSTSMPDYVRLGRMTFTLIDEADRIRLEVEEEQYRPAMETREAWRILWDGYAAPRGRSYFVVMRTPKDDHEDGTASLGIVEVLNRADGLVQRAAFRGLQYDMELRNYQHFTCILVRENIKCITTFIPLIEFDNKTIIKDLCLEETISALKKAARRRKR